jgi:AP-4 complex subunit beta-1
MIRDKDPQVVYNCVCALNEILKDEGGIAVNKKLAMYLLSRLKDFNEWAQCIVLDTILKYTPEGDEVYDYLVCIILFVIHACI